MNSSDQFRSNKNNNVNHSSCNMSENESFPLRKNPQLSLEDLVEKVYLGFSTKIRPQVKRDLIREVLSNLDLSNKISSRSAPRLHLHRLIFKGEKHLHTENKPQAIHYDQIFSAGVNVVLIPDNDVGKSSILKTIKFALTGEDSDFDADVKSWIRQIWLQFGIDQTMFTIHIDRNSGTPEAILVLGEESRSIEDMTQIPNILYKMKGIDNIKDILQQFFFQQLGTEKLSWTQQDPSVAGGIAQRSTTWKTYFQALLIPPSGDQYLLCDPQHAMGNQEGLIFSVFLGLRLVEPLNQLGVEIKLTAKQDKLSAEEREKAQQEYDALNDDLRRVQSRIAQLDVAQRNRRAAFKEEPPIQRLSILGPLLSEKNAEKVYLEDQREKLSKRIKQRHARARNIREAIALRLHFTGLEVSLCPNCDAQVDETAVDREQKAHSCRLCGKPAYTASPEEISSLEAEEVLLEDEAGKDEDSRSRIVANLRIIKDEISRFSYEEQNLRDIARQGIDYIFPTTEEDDIHKSLYEQVGQLRAQIKSVKQNLAGNVDKKGEADLRLHIINKTRKILQDEALKLNQTVLRGLSSRTQELAQLIGADSITDVTCSPFGIIKLHKHNAKVTFKGIKNQGERLRVKLSFFLAMMRLGREPGQGRHPGFLLIDQPGTAEMVEEDFRALAHALHKLDNEMGNEMQIICFTARKEFKSATVDSKVYGPQAPPFAF